MEQPVNNLQAGQAVGAFGIGIAEAQRRLDAACIRLARVMAGLEGEPEIARPYQSPSGQRYSLLELGFMPIFYQFTHVTIELKVAVHLSQERKAEITLTDKKAKGLPLIGPRTYLASINGNYASRYQYSASSASRIRTKLAAVPVPDMLDTWLRRQLKAGKQKETGQP